MRRLLGAWAVGAVLAVGCGPTEPEPEPTGTQEPTQGEPVPIPVTPPVPPPVTPPVPPPVSPPVPAVTPPPPPVIPPVPPVTPPPDPGTGGGGTDPGDVGQELGAGPWPNEPLVNYSQRYGLGRVRAMAVDDAYNLWLLDGDRIGVLRPGDGSPKWTSGVGQAAPGFGWDKLALGSTVICGGSAGRAYVGYSTYELDNAFIYSPDGRNFPHYDDPDSSRFDPVRYQEYQKGDLDVVRLRADGTVELEEHLQRSAGGNGPMNVGIRNTNDHHFDEDRTVLSCTKVMKGAHKGDVYIGTNHGVTRIQGLTYNSHRHPVWFRPKPDGGATQMAGFTYALGISQTGDVLIGNDWNVGVVTPSAKLVDWDDTRQSVNPEKLNAHVAEVNSLEDKDFWRGFQQTTDGRYYVASRDFGLWDVHILRRSEARSSKVSGLPTDRLTALAATDDGSLFIGTDGYGLWRLDKDKKLSAVGNVQGGMVLQVLYDPTVKPAMLYVLTNAGLTVLRGY